MSSVPSTTTEQPKRNRTGIWIAGGLLLGILCGVLFGEYCGALEVVGNAYVGLLQMTVLPYLMISLVAKMGRLDLQHAKKIGFAALVVLLLFWVIGIVLVVAVSEFLPPVQGASFYSPTQPAVAGEGDLLERFIPTNIFRSLTDEYVPAVVVFCLFFGCALILVPGKEPLLDFLDVASAALGQINSFLVRLAPIGLFALTAAAAGTLRVDELVRLKAYLIVLSLACLIAAFGILPLLVSWFTEFRYGQVLRAAQEPLLTAIATGKLFVVLPQIIEKCEELTSAADDPDSCEGPSMASVVVPLAYPFPHLGKILSFVFVSFAAWYVGQNLTTAQTAAMASTGALSSFASPLTTIPYLLDEYKIQQDVMPLFILPGFITMRLADLVGVMSLMSLTLVVTQVLRGSIRIRWTRLLSGVFAVVLCLIVGGVGSRWYLSKTQLEYDLDDRLLSLEVAEPHEDVMVYRSRDEVPARTPFAGSTLQRMMTEKRLRVGYHPGHLPYTYFNRQDHLVGYDVELVHRLAKRLGVRAEFVPYRYETLAEQIETGEIDVAVGGVMLKPERLAQVGFSKPYQLATLSVVIRDHRRNDVQFWNDPQTPADLRLGSIYEDVAIDARRRLPNADIIDVDSFEDFFTGKHDLDGMLIAAEEGAAWNVLHPEYAVVVPEPVTTRPVAMLARVSDPQWLRFLDGWVEFERVDGSLDRLRDYWIQGGGTRQRPARWCVTRDVLHWLP
jgi:Na+/H+-dicarboxylate symporter/ABC-type amino acid transport substrate-binding protein